MNGSRLKYRVEVLSAGGIERYGPGPAAGGRGPGDVAATMIAAA